MLVTRATLSELQLPENDEESPLKIRHICYLPAVWSVFGKTVPEVLDTVLKTEGTVFPDMDQLRLVNKIFLF